MTRPVALTVRAAIPWLVLAAGLLLATLPVWRPLLFGAPPGLDDLLTLRCGGGRA